MTYATKQDLIDRYGLEELTQLTDRLFNGQPNNTIIDLAIADASAEIDGYLAGRYTLPLTTVPSALSRIASDIARYYLYDDRMTEQVAKRYDTAIQFLKAVGKGELDLGVAGPGSQVVPASDGPQYAAPSRVFTADSLGDY